MGVVWVCEGWVGVVWVGVVWKDVCVRMHVWVGTFGDGGKEHVLCVLL